MPYSAPERQIISAGIPGYQGHIPSESIPHEAYSSLRSATSNHSTRHDRFAYNRSLQPSKMPIVGYTGHLRNTKTSGDCYGTSRWRSRQPVTRSAQLAHALSESKQRALMSGLNPDDRFAC
jgi:hypothetical protein